MGAWGLQVTTTHTHTHLIWPEEEAPVNGHLIIFLDNNCYLCHCRGWPKIMFLTVGWLVVVVMPDVGGDYAAGTALFIRSRHYM